MTLPYRRRSARRPADPGRFEDKRAAAHDSLLYKSVSMRAVAGNDLALILWVLFLFCLLVPLAVIINTKVGRDFVQSEMADHIARPAGNVGSLTEGPI